MDAESSAERRQRIRAAIDKQPSKMTLQLARELGVPEVEVIRALPDGRALALDETRWEDIIRGFEGLGKVHVLVSNSGATLESVGEFGGFTTWGEFFNVQTKSLDMHIRWGQLASIFAVEKPGHMDGVNTVSFQFFDPTGAAAFKVFLSFGGQTLSPDRMAKFADLRERFRKER